MQRLPHLPPVRHEYSELPLGRWVVLGTVPPFTTGGKWVHYRTGLPPGTANLIAELAGIGLEKTR